MVFAFLSSLCCWPHESAKWWQNVADTWPLHILTTLRDKVGSSIYCWLLAGNGNGLVSSSNVSGSSSFLFCGQPCWIQQQHVYTSRRDDDFIRKKRKKKLILEPFIAQDNKIVNYNRLPLRYCCNCPNIYIYKFTRERLITLDVYINFTSFLIELFLPKLVTTSSTITDARPLRSHKYIHLRVFKLFYHHTTIVDALLKEETFKIAQNVTLAWKFITFWLNTKKKNFKCPGFLL